MMKIPILFIIMVALISFVDSQGPLNGPVSPGDEIEYNITVCNSGNLTMNNVTVQDSMFGSWNAGDLVKGGCNSTTKTHTVTQDDVCRGFINNTAGASGVDYCDKAVKTEADANWNVSTEHNASLSITKTADKEGPVAPGEDIEYTIIVCNTGNLTIKNVTVLDSMFGSWDAGDLVKGACNSTTKTYTVTQDDVCSGWINNTAGANGVDYCGNFVETDADADWNVRTEHNASLSITKTADVNSPVGPGDVIEYAYVITNTGNVNLSNVTLEDDRLGPIIKVV
jgi:uncharacterized repeat protein (TIGR01451 family)